MAIIISRYFLKVILVVIPLFVLVQSIYSALAHYNKVNALDWPWNYGFIPSFDIQIFLTVIFAMSYTVRLCVISLDIKLITIKEFFKYYLLIWLLCFISFVFLRGIIQPLYEGFLLSDKGLSDILISIVNTSNLERIFNKTTIIICGVGMPIFLILFTLLYGEHIIKALKR